MITKKYRIALDARPLSTPVSGVGRLIAEILYHFPEKEKYEFHLFSHLPVHKEHSKILELSNIVPHIGKGLFSKKGGLYFLVTLPLEIRKTHFDLFWGSQQVVPFFLPKKLPVVLTYCDLVLYLYPQTMRKIAQIQQRIFQYYSVKRADYILSISENTRNDQIKKFHYKREQTSVSYPGIDLEEIKNFLLKEPSEKVKNLPKEFLLSVSTIEPRKNYPFLLQVFREYRKTSNPLPWVIVGKRGWESKEFFQELEKDIQTYGDILVLEGVNDIDLHHIYSRCSLFLFASHYEGFGIPLLEALAHNRKCLVSDIATFHEIGSDQVEYLSTKDSNDIKRWVQKILELLKSSKFPKIDLEYFSWKNSAIQTKNAFDRFLV